MKKLIQMAAIVTVMAFQTSANAGEPCGATSAPTMDIVDTAVSAGQFNTLAAALGAAGLVETLKGAGPFTVFAPTDAAFAKLPAGTVEALLADIPALTNILTYHVAGGDLSIKELVNQGMVTTVQGKNVEVRIENKMLYINESQVVAKPIKATNGIIYVIDSVLLP
jgi:uncharacterized surface protein with fasciclin (FAS1) repeats